MATKIESPVATPEAEATPENGPSTGESVSELAGLAPWQKYLLWARYATISTGNHDGGHGLTRVASS